jgi:hypothetical protein
VLEGTTQDTTYYDRNIAGSSITYLVKAVDTTGNKSLVAASVVHQVDAPDAPQVTFQFIGSEYEISITPSQYDQIPISEFLITSNSVVVFRGKSSVFKATVDWVGARSFDVVVINTAGRQSALRQVTGVVSAPTAPTPTVQVIDNNVLLRWSNGISTLPIIRTEIRKGILFTSAEVLQSIDGTFATYFESQGSVYTYWLVHVDSAGNYGTPVSITATVAAPPDFVLFAEFNADLSAGTLNNAVFSEGSVIFGVNTTQTWTTHFTGNSWDQPQDQVTAGYPVYIQPTGFALDSYYQQDFDIGTVVGSCVVTVTPTIQVVAGNPGHRIDIFVKALPGDPWTTYSNANKVYVSNVRYIRIKITANDDSADDVLRLTGLHVSTGLKLQDDAGSGVASSADVTGTPVVFNKDFIDIVSIVVTPLSTTARFAVYDFADVPDPTGFSVYLFDINGNRVSGNFSWTARGY